MNNNISIALLSVILLFFLPSCTSLHPIEDTTPQNLFQEISIGDKVELITRQGDVYKFKVENIDESSLSGEDVVIMFDDIEKIYKREFTNDDITFTEIVIFVVAAKFALEFILREVYGIDVD